jgi:hypothetical protein
LQERSHRGAGTTLSNPLDRPSLALQEEHRPLVKETTETMTLEGAAQDFLIDLQGIILAES